MSWSTVVNSIRLRFLELVAAPIDLRTVFDNQPVFDAEPPPTKWCRLSIQGADRFQASMASSGSERYRTPGIAFVQFFVPVASGDADLLALVDSLDSAFLGVELTASTSPRVYIRFRPPVPLGLPAIDAETWWRQDVHIPFQSDFHPGA